MWNRFGEAHHVANHRTQRFFLNAEVQGNHFFPSLLGKIGRCWSWEWLGWRWLWEPFSPRIIESGKWPFWRLDSSSRAPVSTSPWLWEEGYPKYIVSEHVFFWNKDKLSEWFLKRLVCIRWRLRDRSVFFFVILGGSKNGRRERNPSYNQRMSGPRWLKNGYLYNLSRYFRTFPGPNRFEE